MAIVDTDAPDLDADLRLGVEDGGAERMAIEGVAAQGRGVQGELTTPALGRQGDLDLVADVQSSLTCAP